MLRYSPARLWITAASLLLAVVYTDVAQAENPRTTLVIGKVSDNPKKHFPRFKPMVDYAAARMRDVGITGGEVLFARTPEQMVRLLRQGRIDWVTETAYAAVLFEERAGAEAVLLKWKKGVPDYRSVFFARKDSGITRLADLVGRKIAFEDPGSTSGFFSPVTILLAAGLQLERLDSPLHTPLAGVVNFAFSGEEINSSTWVHKGIVEVGVTTDRDWAVGDEVPAEFQKDMAVFHTGEPFPRNLEILRAGLDPGVRTRLIEILLSVADDPEAAKVLRAYEKTTRFEPVSPQVRARLDEVKGQLGAVRDVLQ